MIIEIIVKIIAFAFIGFVYGLMSPFLPLFLYLASENSFDETTRAVFLMSSALGASINYYLIFDALCRCGCKEDEKENK